MTGEDLLRTIELLQQHATDEQMRPCHGSERCDRMGTVENGGTEPVGTADGEGQLGPALITPSGDAIGERSA